MNLSGSNRVTITGQETSSGSYVTNTRHRRGNQTSSQFQFPKGQKGAAKGMMDALEANEKHALQGEAGKLARELVTTTAALM